MGNLVHRAQKSKWKINMAEKISIQEENEGQWLTSMGAMFIGERVVCRGKDLFGEFAGKRWMELLLYGITGREFNETEVLMFEQIWVLCSNYPEPRIWNNRISALAATGKATSSLGVAASVAVTEATIYGVPPLVNSLRMLKKVQMLVDQDQELNSVIVRELKEKRVLGGYGRPFVKKDERVKPLMMQAEKLGFSEGRHVKLAFEIEAQLIESRFRMSMNIGALIAALAADFGLNDKEFEAWMTLAFSAGFMFCFTDVAKKREGAFFPFRCERISYEGASARAWEN